MSGNHADTLPLISPAFVQYHHVRQALLTSPARHNGGPPGPVASAISFQELLEKKPQNLNL